MDKTIIEGLIRTGLSQRGLATTLNCSQSTIKYWLRQYSLRCESTKFSGIDIYLCSCGEFDPEQFVNVGKGRRSKTTCRRCHSLRTTKRNRDRKLQAISYKGGRCQGQGCHYTKNCPGALVFHHRDPTKKDPQWRSMKNWSFDKIKDELDKCDLLCATCHAEIHWIWGHDEMGS